MHFAVMNRWFAIFVT